MSQIVLVSVTAPANYRNSVMHTPYGTVSVPANGVVSVDSRLLGTLLKVGFTCATVPNISDKSTMGATVTLAAPAGVTSIQGGIDIKVVAGHVTVPRDMVATLLNEGFTL